ncbi:MAG: hypothetical protein ABW114_04825 [Gaiellaceae bacterium]
MSPRLRILGAVAVALLALAGGYLLLGGSTGSSTAAVKTIKPLHPVKKHVAAAKKQPAPAAKRVVAAVKAKPKRKRAPAVIDGMPGTLALALRSHRVVVVSLYTPGASVDAMATEEARHGAALAGAGFVSFNVADDKVVAPLSSLLTAAPTPADRVLDGPAVLVFERPSSLFVRFNGFADRDTVAQAAANAATLAR